MQGKYTMATKNTFLEFQEVPTVYRRSMSFPHVDLNMLPLENFKDCKPRLSDCECTCSTNASDTESVDTPNSKKSSPWRRLDEYADDHALEESSWTTVMIRNIPNRYTQEELLEEIFKHDFDMNFLHLPLVSKSNANVGYAFANFSTPHEARAFMRAFTGHPFLKQANTEKYAAANYARLQGFEENISFFESRRIAATDRKPWIKATECVRVRSNTM